LAPLLRDDLDIGPLGAIISHHVKLLSTRPHMARIDQPRSARSRRTLAGILDAAWALVEARGGEAFSMAEVSQRAGVSRRALYLHFASRAQLMIALMAHIDESLDVESSVRPISEAENATAMLRAWADHVADYHAKIRTMVQAADRMRRGDVDAAAFWQHAMDVWHRSCLRMARRLASENRLAAPWTTRTAADLLWALMSVDLLEDLTVDRGWSRRQYADRLFTVASRALLDATDD
jgi:AcrR family transcriptional regulator